MTGLPLIGLSGYAGSGKDTAAAGLVAAGWQRRAFADRVRQVVYATDPIILDGRKVASLAGMVDRIGWDEAKRHAQVRALLQQLGQAVRDQCGQDTWVRPVLADRTGPTVISDVRYPNEAEAIRTAGGLVCRIVRPGVGPVNGHLSEHALDQYGFDLVVVNNGSPDRLAGRLARAAARRR